MCETVPAGYTQCFPTGTTARAAATATAARLGDHAGLGRPDTGNDFGNFQNGTKSGTKFDDLNANGQRDDGEPGIGGVEIHLFGTDNRGNAVHMHTNTANDGTYSFSAPPGSYTACETVPDGYTQSSRPPLRRGRRPALHRTADAAGRSR